MVCGKDGRSGRVLKGGWRKGGRRAEEVRGRKGAGERILFTRSLGMEMRKPGNSGEGTSRETNEMQ